MVQLLFAIFIIGVILYIFSSPIFWYILSACVLIFVVVWRKKKKRQQAAHVEDDNQYSEKLKSIAPLNSHVNNAIKVEDIQQTETEINDFDISSWVTVETKIIHDDMPCLNPDFDNNNNNEVYVRDGNSVFKANGEPITEVDIPYLIRSGFKHSLEKAQQEPKRTEYEHQLEMDFWDDNGEQISYYEHQIVCLRQKAHAKNYDIDSKIDDCHKAVAMFYEFKHFCYSSPGGKIYFQDTWERCHNSQNPCFCYIDNTVKLLQDLEGNYEANKIKLLRQEQYDKQIKTFIKDLDDRIINFIGDNPGYLQKDIYSALGAQFKSAIISHLMPLVKNGTITRVKKGNTFELYLTRGIDKLD